MSKVLNTSNSYDIINRKEILTDSNTSATGALSTAISNPIQKLNAAYLLSRVGNAGNTDRKPTSGYCLHFDSTNVVLVNSIYIQTNIPSTERVNYNIVIKGEGTIDLLQVDTSDTNIRIVPKQAITDAAYFDLSYIAFKNITTGKIDHLFECEENSGTLLYDAVTGDTATITSSSGSIVSLPTLRSTTKYKEWIVDEDTNLDNSIKCSSVYGNTSLKTVPAELSLCVTLQMTQEQYDNINVGIFGATNGTSYFTLLRRDYEWNPGITWTYKNANLAEESSAQIKYGFYNSVMSSILDGKPHKLVCCIGDRIKDKVEVESYSDKGLKFFLDGVAVVDTAGGKFKQFLNTPVEFETTNPFRLDTLSTYPLNGGGTISNIKYFNFDISADGAPYSLEDYQNDKDVPNSLQVQQYTDYKNYLRYPTATTPVNGTITATTNTLLTIDNYTTSQYSLIPASGSTDASKMSLKEGSTVYMKFIVDAYYLNNGVIDYSNHYNINARIGGTLNDVNYTNGYYYEQIGKYRCKISDSTGAVIVDKTTITNSGSQAFIPYQLWRDAETYTVSSPKTLELWLTIKDNVYVTPGTIGQFTASLVINTRGNTQALTGTIELVDFKVIGSVLELNNFSKSNGVWLDSSTNNYTMTLTGTYDLPNKNYGTWCNGVGYNNTTYLLGFNNWNAVPSMPYGFWDNNHFTGTPTVSGNSITYTKTGADGANFYYSVLFFGWTNSSAYARWKGKQLNFSTDNVAYTFTNGERDIAAHWLRIYYTDSEGDKSIQIQKTSLDPIKYSWVIPENIISIDEIQLLIFISDSNRITLTAGDTITYTNPKCWVEDFENVSIPTSVTNTFVKTNVPRKLLS